MSKVKGEISNDFCPQTLYLYGCYEEDGVTPHFGLFCWYGWCATDEGGGALSVMACIGGGKRTKDLIRKTGVFSANLVTQPLLPLADYYGCVNGRETPDKMKRLPTVERGQALDVPTIAESPVSFELRVVKELALTQPENSDDASTLFLCKVENVTIDERLCDRSLPVMERMRISQAVSTVAEETYVNFFGQELGRWGEPMKTI